MIEGPFSWGHITRRAIRAPPATRQGSAAFAWEKFKAQREPAPYLPALAPKPELGGGVRAPRCLQAT